MKIALAILAALGFLTVACVGQPVMTSATVAGSDIDGDESHEVEYLVGAYKVGELPERWEVGFSLEPIGQTRLLRSSNQRIEFVPGELIDSGSVIYKEVIQIGSDTTREFYSLRILSYRAILSDSWEYSTKSKAFESEVGLIIGVRFLVGSGSHNGWMRLSRVTADSHSPFQLSDYTFHPVPDEPIRAGEPPSPPPLQASIGIEGVSFSWDPRWGSLVLEAADGIVSPVVWTRISISGGGPVSIPIADQAQRFFRLRAP